MEAYGRDFASGLRGSAYRRFLIARFGRIYPLHLFTLLAMAAFVGLGWMPVVDPPGSFAASVVLVQGFTFVPLVWNGPAWSISTEWYVYLLFPLMVPVLMRLPAASLRACWVAVAIAVTVLFVKGSHDAGGDEWPPFRLILCATEFAFGCLTHRLVRTMAWPQLRHRALASVVFVAPIVLLALPERFESAYLYALVAVGFAVSIGVLAAEDTMVDRLLGSRVLQWLGKTSYSIYLNHEILFRLARSAADGWTGRTQTIHDLPTAWALALFVVYVAVLLLTSWATWRWIEEPLRHWFKRRARRKPATAPAIAPR